jgi:hypothetical protein
MPDARFQGMNTTKGCILLVLPFLALVLLAGCSTSDADRYPIGTKSGVRLNDMRARFKGYVEKHGPGEYRIRSTTGELYNPENLPRAFQRDGLRVFVFGEIQGPRQPGGRPLEIYEISRASQ